MSNNRRFAELLIKSVSDDQIEIIKNILTLHVPSHKIDCDPTYCRGTFYKKTGITKPKYRYDISPLSKDVKQADCRNLPLGSESLGCIMFDPPSLSSAGQPLDKDIISAAMHNRFGVYPTEKKLHQFYLDSMKEFYRILKYKGILIFKCQDKVSSNKQYFSHVFIINRAVRMGFYLKDLFILIDKNILPAQWQPENQRNARKSHAYFLVFEKCNAKVKYT